MRWCSNTHDRAYFSLRDCLWLQSSAPTVSADVLVRIGYTEFTDNSADAACLRIGSAGGSAGDDCTADSSCSYNNQGTTTPTCVQTNAVAW